METLESVKEAISQLSFYQLGAIGIAAIFLAVGIRLMLKKPPTHLTAFSGSAGTVLVSRKALQDLVRQACLLDEWVEAARPVIRVRKDKITARVELRLVRSKNLKAVCERVQAHITNLLHKSLSFDQIGEIQIVVKSFRPDPEPASADVDFPARPTGSSMIAPKSGSEDRPGSPD